MSATFLYIEDNQQQVLMVLQFLDIEDNQQQVLMVLQFLDIEDNQQQVLMNNISQILVIMPLYYLSVFLCCWKTCYHDVYS